MFLLKRREKIGTFIVTKVSLGPCNKDNTSKADFPTTSSPLTAINSSPYQTNIQC